MALRNAGGAVYVQGLSDMQRVLRQSGNTLAPELKKRLGEAGTTIIAPASRANAPRGTRPHAGRRLADTIKVSITQNGASVYSTSVYGGVQNYGGRVGRNHATILARGHVSQYQTNAVQSTREPVSRHVEGVLTWLARELGS